MSAQTEITKLGNGVGYIYIVNPTGTIVSTLDNNYANKRAVQNAISNSAPISSEILASSAVQLLSGAGTITNITVNGVSVFDVTSAITGGSLAILAANAVNAINTYLSTPDYSAIVSGNNIIIQPVAGTGSSVNGYVVTASVTGTITYSASTMDGGSNPGDSVDGSTGLRVFLNASSSAVYGDRSAGTEITTQIVPRSFLAGAAVKSINIASGLISPVRQGLFTFYIPNSETGGNTADDLDNISPVGFSNGDLLFLRRNNITTQVITVRDTGVSSGNIKLANAVNFPTNSNGDQIVLQYQTNANSPSDPVWFEVTRSPNISLSVANLRNVSIPQPASGTHIQALGLGGGTTNLTPGTDKGYQVITGTGNLAGSWVIQGAGSPIDGDKFYIDYRATWTKGANNVTIFGIALTTAQALAGNILIEATYDSALTGYRVIILRTTSAEDLVNTTQLATKENGLGNPASDGYVLQSTAAGVRSWLNIFNPTLVGSVSTSVTNLAGNVDLDAMSITIPAGTMTALGQAYRYFSTGQTAGNGNVKQITFKINSTTIVTNSVTTSPNNLNFNIEVSAQYVGVNTLFVSGKISFNGVASQIAMVVFTLANIATTDVVFKLTINSLSVNDIGVYGAYLTKNIA